MPIARGCARHSSRGARFVQQRPSAEDSPASQDGDVRSRPFADEGPAGQGPCGPASHQRRELSPLRAFARSRKKSGRPVSRVLSPRGAVTIRLGRPLPAASNDLPGSRRARAAPCHGPKARAPALFGLSSDGVCRARGVTVAAVGSYPTVSPLPDPPLTRRPSAVCSLWHFPGPCDRWPLATILPCEARTFLGRREA